jgi:hypothetical protein
MGLLFAAAPLQPRVVGQLVPLDPAAETAAAPDDSKIASIRTRISWGGGTPESWHGTIAVESGELSEPKSLGFDSPGGIQLIDGALHVRQSRPSSYGGVDVTVDASLDRELRIILFSSEHPDRPFQARLRLDQLLGGPHVEAMDEQNNRLTIARAPGDQLRVQLKQPSLVFQPNELLSLEVRPNLTGISSRAASCRIKIVPARKTAPTLWTNTFNFSLDASGTGRNERFEIPVPEREGVYDLLLELEPNWYQVPFNSRKQSVNRQIQFVVLEDKSPDLQASPEPKVIWHPFDVLDVMTGRSIARPQNPSLQQLNRLVQLPTGPLGNDKRQAVSLNQQKMLELGVGGWHAVQISVEHLNLPHMIELEYFADQPTAIGTSLIQPDASGQIPAIGFDAGVSIERGIVDDELGQTVKTHKLVFWPTTKRPWLLIANRHDKNPVLLGNLRIFSGPARLPSETQESGTPGPTRNFMALYEMPLFTDNFGSQKSLDASLQQQLDDWLTFYEGADRLIQYLKSNSYSGAFVTVLNDGSAIYPSQFLDSTPKYDSGIFFSSGQDPKQKDVLEMLFRMFDREGLKLVPTLSLSATLPAIEAVRDPERAVHDFDLIDFRQQSLSNNRSNVPIYNPLDVQVQKAVTDIVEEIAMRYAAHPSFDSVAIACRPNTYTQLPGQQWCYDATTVNRFVSSLDEQPDATNIHDELLSTYHDQWLQWRADQISDWYLRMLDAVQRHLDRGKLFLAPTDFYRNEEIASALSPSLQLSADYEQVLLRMGLEKKLAGLHPDLVLLNPNRIAPGNSLAAQRVEIQVENSYQANSFFQQSRYPGTVVSSRMPWAHFAELQQHNLFGQQQSPLMRLQQLSPEGIWNRQRLAVSLKEFDSRLLVSGGTILPTSQQDAVTEFVSSFAKLPDAGFKDVSSTQIESSASPVAVRQYNDGQNSYFYVVNGSPWPLKIKLTLTEPPAQPVLSFAGESLEQVGEGASLTAGTGLEVRLDGFGLAGCQLPSGSLAITDYAVEFPVNAEQPLRAQLVKLQSKLAKASKATPLDVLSNTNFSPANQPTLNGWSFGQQPASNIRLEQRSGKNESAALLLSSEGQTVWIRSNSFAPPETGRLSVSVWLKTEDPQRQPPLRLAIEGQTENSDYYRFGSIGALAPESESKRVTQQWQRFAVHFDDLPVQGIENLRIGFDLMGAGQVWIDDVAVYDRWFDGNDTKAITQMLASASLMLTQPEKLDQCRRILNSYWPRFLDEHFPDPEYNDDNDEMSELVAPQSKLPAPLVPESQTRDRNGQALPNPPRRQR